MLAIEDTEPRCVFHARGDRRDHIDVLCSNIRGAVKVAGDDSRFVNLENLPPETKRLMLDKIAWQRINSQEASGSQYMAMPTPYSEYSISNSDLDSSATSGLIYERN
jgi:hypothetical protein